MFFKFLERNVSTHERNLCTFYRCYCTFWIVPKICWQKICNLMCCYANLFLHSMLPICAVDWTDFKFINCSWRLLTGKFLQKLVLLLNCVELVALGRIISLCEANRIAQWLCGCSWSRRLQFPRGRRGIGGGGGEWEEKKKEENRCWSAAVAALREDRIHETSSSECVLRIVSASQSSYRFYQQVLNPSKVGFVCFNVICMLEFSLGWGILFFGSHCESNLLQWILNHQVRRFVGFIGSFVL